MPLLSGLFCITTLVPGGAKGTWLKSWFPNRYVHADNVGLTLEFRRRLITKYVWGDNLSYSLIGKSGLHVMSAARRWSLNLCNVCYAALHLYQPGGSSWNLIPSFVMSFRLAEHLLSKIYNSVLWPLFVNVYALLSMPPLISLLSYLSMVLLICCLRHSRKELWCIYCPEKIDI